MTRDDIMVLSFGALAIFALHTYALASVADVLRDIRDFFERGGLEDEAEDKAE